MRRKTTQIRYRHSSVAQFIAFVYDHGVSQTLQSGNTSDAWTLTANAAGFMVVNLCSATSLCSALSAVVNPWFTFFSLQSLRIFLIEFPVIVRSDYHNNFGWNTLYSFINVEIFESIYGIRFVANEVRSGETREIIPQYHHVFGTPRRRRHVFLPS